MGTMDDIVNGKINIDPADSFSARKQQNISTPGKLDSTPAKPKGPSNWDARIQPVIDANGWDKNVNYSNSVHIMKAVNGRYDHVLNAKDVDPALKEKISQFKNNSWSFAKELEKGSTGPVDSKKITMYRNNANKLWSEISGSLNPGKNKAYVVDDKQRIVSRKQFDKDDQLPEILKSGSWSGEDGFGSSSSPTDAYVQLKGYNDSYRNNLKTKIKPVVGKWLNTSLNLLNSDYEDAKKIDPDNRLNAYKITTDVLKHIEKYGTTNGDETIDGRNKQLAVKILGEMRGVTEWKDKLNVIKKYSNVNGENQISDLANDIGYYGSKHVFDKHKTTLGKNDKYFGGDKKLQNSMDHIDRLNDDYKEFQDTDKKLRMKALNIVKSTGYGDLEGNDGRGVKDSIYDSLIGSNGAIADFDTWKKKMRSVRREYDGWDNSQLTGKEQYTKEGRLIGNENHLADVFDKNKSSLWSIWANDRGLFQSHDPNKVARNVYNQAVKTYKEKFQDIKVPHVFKSTLLQQGLGDNMNPRLRYNSVDLSMDKNGNLIKSEGPKAENINKIFSLMKDEDGNIDKESVTFLNDHYTKNEFVNVSKNDMVNLKEKNDQTYKDFFKHNKMDDVSVTFVRNASVKYHSAYVFKNNETGKEMTMIVPQEKLKTAKEPMFENTRLSGNDYTFQVKGKKEIPDREGVYKNAFIREERGQKVAYFKYKNEDGVWEDDEYAIKGDATINQATKIFDAHISNSLR